MTRTLLSYLKQHPLLLWAVVALSIVVPVAAVLPPLFAGAAIDGRQGAIGGLLIAATFRFAMHGSRRFLAGTLSVRVQHDLRISVMRRLLRIDSAAASSLRTGHVVSRTISDLSHVQSMVATLPIIISGLVETALIIGIILWLSVPVGLLVLVHVPIMFAIAAHSRRRLYPATWKVQQQTADIAAHIEQSVSGVRVVKNYGQQNRMYQRFSELARDLFGYRMVVGRIMAAHQPLLNTVPQIMLVGIVLVGGWLATTGHMSVGEFLAAATFVTMLARLTRMTAAMLVEAFVARSSMHRVEELLGMQERPHPDLELPHQTQPNPVIGITGTVTARDGSTIPVDITPGQATVIQGSPASGKSFLAYALAGLHTRAAADLMATLADGTQIALTDVPESDRPLLVLDEPFLFSSSIRDNVRLGFPASDDDVWNALNIARAQEFVERLGGLDTVVGERGLTLSGGQRQRIALARAVLRGSSFLIFDDATSAIDALTERQIMSALAEAARSHTDTQDMTLVVISHRHQALTQHSSQVHSLPLPPAETHELWPAEAPAPIDPEPEPVKDAEQITPGAFSPTVTDYSAPFGLRSLLALIRIPLIAVVATLLLTVIADVTVPSFIRHALDEGVAHGNQSVVTAAAAGALAVVLISWLALALNTVLTMRAGENLLYALRLRCYRHLGRMDMGWFERHSSGQIMTRLTTDIDSLSNFLSNGLSQTIVSLTVLIGVAAMLLLTDPTLTGITALFLPIIGIASWVFKRQAARLYSESRTQVSQVNATFQESVYGLVTSQGYGYGSTLLNRLDQESARYRRLRTQAQAAVSVFFPGINWITELAQASILAMGTALIAEGHTTQGAVVAFSLYLSIFFGPVQQLSQIFDSFQQASVGLSRIGTFLRTVPQVVSPSSPRPVPQSGSPSLIFDATRFWYATSSDDDRTQLRPELDIDTTFTGVTAVVGATGAGKSTLGKLVARWYDPQQGSLAAVYGTDRNDPALTDQSQLVPLKELDVQDWRRQIGTVPQEPYFFPTNVAHNIAFGQPSATNEEIEQAVRAIGGESIIASIPGGFLAPVGERAHNLSAAQRQIVALARAELLHPAIMVLDEATSTLPPEMERDVVAAISRAVHGRTALIIAHRLSTAEHADRVIVMDGGKIVESGTHEQLLTRGQRYAQLWNSTHL